MLHLHWQSPSSYSQANSPANQSPDEAPYYAPSDEGANGYPNYAQPDERANGSPNNQ